jgi:large subunit ribosomal protein L17
MRHGNKINHLGRKKAHRDALMKNLSNALITNKRITTTLAKAKELRKHIEPLLTKCKTDTTHSRRMLFSYLQDKEIIKELFGNISEKIANRPGGYTRIIKLGFRYSDAAEMAMIELVDFNEVYNTESTDSTKTRRSRRKASSNTVSTEKSQVEASSEAFEEAIAEETITEEVVEQTEVVEDVEEIISETEENTKEEVVTENEVKSEEGSEQK